MATTKNGQCSGKKTSYKYNSKLHPGVRGISDIKAGLGDVLLIATWDKLVTCQPGGAVESQFTPASEVESAIMNSEGVLYLTGVDKKAERNPQLFKKTPGGNWQVVLKGKFSLPTTLSLDLEGNLLLLDRWLCKIFIISTKGPEAIVTSIDLKGVTTWERPWSLSSHPSGNIVLSDQQNHCIHIFSRDGVLVQTIGTRGTAGKGSDHLNSPHGICVNSEGHILVSDCLNNRVGIFDEKGHHLGDVNDEQDGLVLPKSICLLHNGNLVVEYGKNNLCLYTPDK